MTTTLAAVPRSSLLRTTLHRFAERRLGNAAKTRPLALIPKHVDAQALAELSDHLLRDIGLVREPGVRLSSTFPYL